VAEEKLAPLLYVCLSASKPPLCSWSLPLTIISYRLLPTADLHQRSVLDLACEYL